MTEMPGNGIGDTSTQHSEVTEADYPWWSSSWVVKKVVFERQLSGYWLGLLIFAVYWGIPLLFSLFSGTVLLKDILTGWSASLSDTSRDLLPIASYLTELAQGQMLHGDDSLSYLTDKTHFAFALIISIGAGIATRVVRSFNATIIQLRQGEIPVANESELIADYLRYRKRAAHPLLRFMSFVLAVITVLIFYYIASDSDNSDWWGYSAYGKGGVVFAVIEGFMVYWGSRTIILMGMGSLMLAKFIDHPITLRPFHPDGCNGLAPLGRQIIFLWLFALSLAFAIYVTLSFGYLGIEKKLIVWILAALGTIMIPALAVWPLMASLRAIQSAQRLRLAHFEKILNSLLDNTEQLVQSNQCDQAMQTVEQMNGIQAAHTVINSANVWPFNPRALVGIMIVNIVQIILTLKELVGVFE